MAYDATFHKSKRQLEDEGPAFEYTPENRARFDQIIKRYPADAKRSAVLPALYLVQYQQGYITANAIRHVAELLKITPPPKDRVYTEMEALIQHFLIYSQGFTVPAGEAYVPVEGPRGEQGFYVVSDGTNRPWRVKSRAPSLLACQALERLIVGGLIADVIAVIGSIDVVMGDVDR